MGKNVLFIPHYINVPNRRTADLSVVLCLSTLRFSMRKIINYFVLVLHDYQNHKC